MLSTDQKLLIKLAKRLTSLMLGPLLMIILLASLARAIPLNNESVAGRIVAINGNIITVAGGFLVDISQTEFGDHTGRPIERPEIRVGDLLNVSGKVTSQLGEPVMIVSQKASVETGKEFYFWGTAQQVDTGKNTITILGKQVQIAADAMLLNKKFKPTKFSTFKSGDNVAIDVLNGSAGPFTNFMYKVRVPKQPLEQLEAVVKSVKGTVLELECGITVDIKPFLDLIGNDPEGGPFIDINTYTPGSDISLHFPHDVARNPAQGPLPADGLGLYRTPITIAANLQAIDTVENSITVLNRKLLLPANVYIQGPRGQISLSQMVIGQSMVVYADRNGDELVVKFLSQPFVN